MHVGEETKMRYQNLSLPAPRVHRSILCFAHSLVLPPLLWALPRPRRDPFPQSRVMLLKFQMSGKPLCLFPLAMPPSSPLYAIIKPKRRKIKRVFCNSSGSCPLSSPCEGNLHSCCCVAAVVRTGCKPSRRLQRGAGSLYRAFHACL